MRGHARPVRHTGFSLTRITNLASCLMTVLLALNLHSLAAQVSQPGGTGIPSGGGAAGEKVAVGSSPGHGVAGKEADHTADRPQPTAQHVLMNRLQGWTPANGLMEDDAATGQRDEDTPDERVQQAELGLSDELAAHRRAMRSHAEALQHQRQALEAEQKELNEKLQALSRNASELSSQQEQRRKDVEQKELNEKLQALSRNASELSSQQEQRRKDVEAGIARLAHVYEQMPPRDAAAMFNVLDMRVMVPVAQHMIPRRISDVIGNMQPDRANILSQYLAGIRKLSPDAILRMNSPTDYNIAP